MCRVDIWALGCCLYGLLFLNDCFQDASTLEILTGMYQVPRGHPYSNDTLDLLSRMLEPDAKKRLNIYEVISCIDALTSGKSLPPSGENDGNMSFHKPLAETMSLDDQLDPLRCVFFRLPERALPLNYTLDDPIVQTCREGDEEFLPNSEISEKTRVRSIALLVKCCMFSYFPNIIVRYPLTVSSGWNSCLKVRVGIV